MRTFTVLRQFLNAFVYLILIVLLTVLTQVGGLIFLLCLPLFSWLRRKQSRPFLRFIYQTSLFLLVYGSFSWLIVPPLAVRYGRVAHASVRKGQQPGTLTHLPAF